MQTNPYEVLGVGPGATDDQIKDAYRRLARKYQADEYRAGPLADVAGQRMRELDDAYDAVMQARRSEPGGYRGARGAYQEAPGGYGGGGNYPDVRAKLAANRIDDAETLLDGVPAFSRDAEWNYLKGYISQQRGWLDEAERYFSFACEQDPSNIEYAAAYNRLRNDRSGGYRTSRHSGGMGDGRCSACDICSGLLCADCCCECMGGDCIRCC